MSGCLRCVYVDGKCKKCARVRGAPKVPGPPMAMRADGIEGLIGEAHPPLTVRQQAEENAYYGVEEGQAPPAAPNPSCQAAAGVTPAGALSPSSGAEALPASSTAALPAHSPYGGSAAKRWINCAGSTALIKRLNLPEDSSEYARYGTEGHSLAAACLEREVDAWEIVAEFPLLDPSDAAYVQEYIDYVRSRPGRTRVEVRHHRPELHPQMYGTVDVEIVPVLGSGPVLEIVDLKFGEGVYVDPVENEQGMYYACLVIMEDPTFWPDEGVVRITIAQPRMPWAETIRSWDTTVGALKHWLYEVCLPAMNRDEATFSLGEWCQFCPAKLVCPAMQEGFAELAAVAVPENAERLISAELGRQLVLYESIKMYGKALTVEAHKRLMDRIDVPGTKLVAQKTDRAWKEPAEAEAKTRYGDDAYTSPKLLSPAQMEKLPGGKTFVAEFAFKPEAGYAVALATDKRAAVVPKSGSELFASVAAQYLDAAE